MENLIFLKNKNFFKIDLNIILIDLFKSSLKKNIGFEKTKQVLKCLFTSGGFGS